MPYFINILIITLIGSFLAWASFTKVDVITRSEGEVGTQQEVQITESLEGGILTNIFVEEGVVVNAGDPVISVENPTVRMKFGILSEKIASAVVQIARLKSEVSGEDLSHLDLKTLTIEELKEIEEEVQADNQGNQSNSVLNELQIKHLYGVRGKVSQERLGQRYNDEMRVYHLKKETLNQEINGIQASITQRELERSEMSERKVFTEEALKIANRQKDIIEPLFKNRNYSEVEYLQIVKEINNLNLDISKIDKEIPKTEAQIEELNFKYHTVLANFQKLASEELSGIRRELGAMLSEREALTEQLSRFVIKSPVRGVVNKIHVNTIGEIVNPSEPIVEIVPLDDEYIMEAKVSPRDIAFVVPGQRAKISLTAYDTAIYGFFEGVVFKVGADTTVSEQTSAEPFYKVLVRMEHSQDKPRAEDAEDIKIIPGMIGQVDILTGEKTVLQYLSKPFTKNLHRIFSER